MNDCVFCKIVSEEVPANFHFKSEKLVAFDDIKPSAETHILIVPKKHIPTFLDIKRENDPLIGEMMRVAQKLIKEKKLEKKYRVSFNGGSLQMVPHLHMHLLGGNLKRIVK